MKKHTPTQFLLWTWLLLCPLATIANNLQIKELSVISSQKIRCLVSWENSWRLDGTNELPQNHDAIWLFVKVKNAQNIWQHLDLSTEIAQYSQSNALRLQPSNDHKGLFISRNTTGSGTTEGYIEIQTQEAMASDIRAVKVCGIEMVYVPEGSFWVGDSLSKFSLKRGLDAAPFQITHNEEISIGTTAQTISGTGEYQPPQAIPSAYPKGFSAFYAMKYEITQAQYADFLNTLTAAQQSSRVTTDISAAAGTSAFTQGNTFRNGLVIAEAAQGNTPAVFACNANENQLFNEENDGQNRACNWLNWADVAAYLDWAALRPLTELEFEKAARGTTYPLKGEFAWGTNLVTDANTPLLDGTAEESVSESVSGDYGIANHSLPFGQTYLLGILRAGFAGTANSNRRSMGASFYGLAEMSGNVWEMCINVHTTSGLTFNGQHGDGEINATGTANAATWPSDAAGTISRGGGWNSLIFNNLSYEFRDLAISDRFYANTPPTNRRNTTGGRGGRSQP